MAVIIVLVVEQSVGALSRPLVLVKVESTRSCVLRYMFEESDFCCVQCLLRS